MILLLVLIFSACGGLGAPAYVPITVSNAAQLQQIATLEQANITAVRFSPDSKTLAIGAGAGIWLYDVNDFSKSPKLLRLEDSFVQMEFAQDGQSILISARHIIQKVSLDGRVEDNGMNPGTALLSPDATTYMTDFLVRFGSVNPPFWSMSLEYNDAEGREIQLCVFDAKAISPDNRLAACSVTLKRNDTDIETQLVLWDVTQPEQVNNYRTIAFKETFTLLERFAFSPDSQQLAMQRTVYVNNSVSEIKESLDIYKLDDLSLIASYPFKDARFEGYGSDGNMLIVLSEDDLLQLLSPQTGAEIAVLGTQANAHEAVMSPDNRFLIAGNTHEVRVWAIK